MVLSLAPFLKEREIQIRNFFLFVYVICARLSNKKEFIKAEFKKCCSEIRIYTREFRFITYNFRSHTTRKATQKVLFKIWAVFTSRLKFGKRYDFLIAFGTLFLHEIHSN